MIVVAGKFVAKPGNKIELQKIMHPLLIASRQDRGCISYNIYQNLFAEDEFLWHEEWQRKEDLDNHFKQPHFLSFMEKFPAFVANDLEIKVYSVSAMNKL